MDFLVLHFFRFCGGTICPVFAGQSCVGFVGSAAASFEDEDFTVRGKVQFARRRYEDGGMDDGDGLVFSQSWSFSFRMRRVSPPVPLV